MTPEVHRHTFLYLVCFLKELLTHANDNRLDAKLLGESRAHRVSSRRRPESEIANFGLESLAYEGERLKP